MFQLAPIVSSSPPLGRSRYQKKRIRSPEIEERSISRPRIDEISIENVPDQQHQQLEPSLSPTTDNVVSNHSPEDSSTPLDMTKPLEPNHQDATKSLNK